MHVKPRVKQLLPYHFENLHGELIPLQCRIHSSTDLAERSTKTGKVSAAQALGGELTMLCLTTCLSSLSN